MGQAQSRRASNPASTINNQPAQCPIGRHQQSSMHSPKGQAKQRIVKPKDFVEEDEETAIYRMLPMVHQKMFQLPARIETISMRLGTCSSDGGPECRLAERIHNLCGAMKPMYKYLSRRKTAPESQLPFPAPKFAEAMGILALQVER